MAATGGFPPLEQRMVELTFDNGKKTKVSALNKHYVPNFKYVSFYMPALDTLDDESSTLDDWVEQMNLFRDDLRWLLRLPHHKFWSVLTFSEEVSDTVLTSFLLRAPRNHEPEFHQYAIHPIIGPIYEQLHDLIFRIFMRLATFKESKEEHITPSKWASLIYDNYFFDIPKLMDLCALYESKKNRLLPQMVENVLKHEPRHLEGLSIVIPLITEKWEELSKELKTFTKGSKNQWVENKLSQLIRFSTDQALSLLKLLRTYPPIATKIEKHNLHELLLVIALMYEEDVDEWKKIILKFPALESRVNGWRVHMINLFRLLLATSTLDAKESNQNGIDDFFGVLSNCLEMNSFLHDYEQTYPFRKDIQTLLSRGVDVDKTRIEYLGNAINTALEVFGVRRSSDHFVNPSFDRQELGACSLDSGLDSPLQIDMGIALSQVKDLLPDLPDTYIQRCLEEYGYNTENTINALLEGTVPNSLDTFKENKLVVLNSTGRSSDTVNIPSKEIKAKVLEAYNRQQLQAEEETTQSHIHHSLLPTFNEDIEYDDEYDDTYDELGVGMSEPDAPAIKPLNIKGSIRKMEEEIDYEEIETNQNRENFVEDPAVLRAQAERRHQTHIQQRSGGGNNLPKERDVVGRAKGHGQEKEVVLNRRKKEESGAHNRRNRSDFKRREF